jgi:hypothetical protein
VKCCPFGESIGISKVCEPSTLNFKVHFFWENGRSNSTAAAAADDDDEEDDYDYIFGDPCLYERWVQTGQISRLGCTSLPYGYNDWYSVVLRLPA